MEYKMKPAYKGYKAYEYDHKFSPCLFHASKAL